MKFLSCIFFLFFCTTILANTNSNDSIKTSYIIKFNPTSVFEQKPTFFDISLEYVLNSKFGIEQSFGILNAFTNVYKKNDEFVPRSLIGIESKTSLKYYFKNFEPNDWSKSVYFAPEIEYAFYTFKRENEYCRYGCSYFEKIKTTTTTNEIGIGIKLGKMYFFGKNKRCVIDVYGGFGYKFISRKVSALPEDATDTNFGRAGFFNIINDIKESYGYSRIGKYSIMDFIFGFRVGYRIP